MLGSAGGPRQALPIVGADTFFIVNGDTLTDLDRARRSPTPRASGALVTLALVPNREPHATAASGSTPTAASTGFVPRGAAAEGSLPFHRRPGGGRGRVRVGCRTAALVNSIGGVYDAADRAQPGSDPRLCAATPRSGISAPSPTTGRTSFALLSGRRT